MVLESGLLQELEERYALTGPLPPLAIPATLQDSLMARLDRLATVKAWRNWGRRWGASLPMPCCTPCRRGTRRRCSRGCTSWWRRSLCTSGAPAAGDLHVQACADSGRGLSVLPQEHAPAVPSAHCAGVGGALSRALRHPARAAGASLHPSGLQCPGHPLLAARGPAGGPAVGLCRSDHASHHGAGAPRDPAQTPERPQHELLLQVTLGPALMATKGWSPRRWNVSTDGRGRSANRWERRRTSFRCCMASVRGISRAANCPKRSRWRKPSSTLPNARTTWGLCWSPIGCWGQPCSSWAPLRRRDRTLSSALPSTIPSTTAPWPCSMRKIPAWPAAVIWRDPVDAGLPGSGAREGP